MNDKQNDWSRTYFGILVNQVLVVGIIALLGTALLGESYRACRAADLAPPGFTRWYFNMGPIAMALAGPVSVGISFAVVGLRRRFVGTVVTTCSFVGCILFLAGGIFSSIAPLLVAVRDMLPAEMKW